MSYRAKKFIHNNCGDQQVFDLIGKTRLAEWLEKFHFECMPTNQEISSRFPYPSELYPKYEFNKTKEDMAYERHQGAYWCRDFVREEEGFTFNDIHQTMKKVIQYPKERGITVGEVLNNAVQMGGITMAQFLEAHVVFDFRRPVRDLSKAEEFLLNNFLKDSVAKEHPKKNLIRGNFVWKREPSTDSPVARMIGHVEFVPDPKGSFEIESI